jgi:hypothetical protein
VAEHRRKAPPECSQRVVSWRLIVGHDEGFGISCESRGVGVFGGSCSLGERLVPEDLSDNAPFQVQPKGKAGWRSGGRKDLLEGGVRNCIALKFFRICRDSFKPCVQKDVG